MNARDADMDVNVTKEKEPTYARIQRGRSHPPDPAPPAEPEQAIEFIADDELVEVTSKPSACAKEFWIPRSAPSAGSKFAPTPKLPEQITILSSFRAKEESLSFLWPRPRRDSSLRSE